MGRVIFFILPLAFGLVVLPHLTAALKVKNLGGATVKKPIDAQAPIPDNAQGPNPLIEQACAKAVNKTLCTHSLKSQPGSDNADLKALAFMSLNVTKTYGSKVANWVSDKLEKEDDKDGMLSPGVEQGLTDCAEQYTDALAQLDDSMVAFFSNGFKDVNTWMSTALTNANTCEEGLKEQNVEGAMGNRNQVFAQYCSNALAVVNEWAKKH